MDEGAGMEALALGERLLWRFADTFGQCAANLLDCRHWVTYAVGPELKIKHFLAGNADADERCDYEHHFFALDPLAPERCLSEGRHVARLRDLMRADLPAHEEYRRCFLARHAIVDALEIFIRSDAGLTVGCSLLRHESEAQFSPEECRRAGELKPLGDFALSQTFPERQVSLEVISRRFPFLTAREIMLVQLVAVGLNNKQLCRELNISLPTVKTHLLNTFRKMGVTSRTELAAKILA